MKPWPLCELEKIKKAGLLRRLVSTHPLKSGCVAVDGRHLIDFSSNDYLGLSLHPALKDSAASAIEEYGVGSRASRLMSGNVDLYQGLERAVARLKGTEAGLVFGSGYLCNLSVTSALVGPGDLIILDRLCHASLCDGALLSRARMIRFGHNDVSNLADILEKKRKQFKRTLICIETVYSMDGDIAPVEELTRLANRFDAILLADEAHAVGVFGDEGEGVVQKDAARKPDILIGTFGKALGSYGAFCASSKALREYILNKARGLIYSTALPPATLAANIKAIEMLPHLKAERARLLDTSRHFRNFVKNGLRLETRGKSQIVPLILKDVNTVLLLEEYLKGQGLLAKAIRPPTVPKDSPRIRFSFSTAIRDEDVSRLEDALMGFFKKGRKH